MATTRIMPLHVGKGRTESRPSATSSTMWQIHKRPTTVNSSPATLRQPRGRRRVLLAKRQYIAATGRVRGKDDVIAYHVRQSFGRARSRRRKPTGWA